MKYQSTSMKPVPMKLEPRNVLPDNHKPFNLETSSDPVIKMQTSPSTVKYGAGTPQGVFQSSGDKVQLGTKPMLGYQSYETPMSNRAIESKKSF